MGVACDVWVVCGLCMGGVLVVVGGVWVVVGGVR
jgi:hypothetical protein